MHLTTILVDRYTGHPDMFRAHLVYHYTVIQILMCLLLYGIGKTLTGSPAAGYCTLPLMYVAVAAPNLWPVASFVTVLKGLSPDTLFHFTISRFSRT
jgi:hypothetical protein